MEKLVQELDFELGKVESVRTVLDNIEVSLSELLIDMERAKRLGAEKMQFKDTHRNIMILAELMRYTMQDFNKDFKNLERIHNEIFERVVKANQNESAQLNVLQA